MVELGRWRLVVEEEEGRGEKKERRRNKGLLLFGPSAFARKGEAKKMKTRNRNQIFYL